MKFTTATENIRNILSIVTRALSVRPPQPILDGVLIEARHGNLMLTASDGTFTIHASIPVNVIEPGRLVAPGRFFTDAIRRLPDGELIATENSNCALTLSCSGARITIGCQIGEDYPSLPGVYEPYTFKINHKAFRDMVGETSFCIADEDPRVILTGALLEVKENTFNMVAIDGFRLAMRKRACEALSDGEKSVVVPKKSLIEIARLLSDDEEREVNIEVDRNYIAVNLENISVYARLIDGEFINYQRIIPAGWKTRVKVNCDQFSGCIERASLIAREGKNNLIRVEISGGRMIVTSNSEIGDSYEEMDVETDGEDIRIAFNVRYMSEAFRAIRDEYVYLLMTSSVSPMTIVPFGGDEFTYLILPVRSAT